MCVIPIVEKTGQGGRAAARGRSVASAKRRFYRALRYGASSAIDSDEAQVIMADDELEVASKSSRRKSSLAASSVLAASEAGTLAAGAGEDEEEGAAGVLGAVLPAEEVQTLMEKAKWYTSMCLGTTSILSVFAFLFAIPFVVEPAISTILADFSPDPVACIMTSHKLSEGLKNCSWASCREGECFISLLSHEIIVFCLGKLS